MLTPKSMPRRTPPKASKRLAHKTPGLVHHGRPGFFFALRKAARRYRCGGVAGSFDCGPAAGSGMSVMPS